jgi:hypothetical protein
MATTGSNGTATPSPEQPGVNGGAADHDNDPGEEKVSFFRVIIHSFFIVPFLIAVVAVLVFVSIQILTSEPQDAYDHLALVRTGSANRRWQSAVELSKLLAAPEQIPEEPRFVNEMLAAFAEGERDDPRVRQYLALAMASSGIIRFIDPMRAALADSEEGTQYTLLVALGLFRAGDGTPLPAVADSMLPFLDHQSARVRAGAATGLGLSGVTSSAERLQPLLFDPDPSVTWDAALALARLGDLSGKQILLRLLDRGYFAQFPNVDDQDQNLVMATVIEVAAPFADEELQARFVELSRTDGSLNVRRIAQQVVAD